MLRTGIPERGNWPPGALEAVAAFRQGDLVGGLPLFYWADPDQPVHARTQHYAAEIGVGNADPGPQVVEVGFTAPYGLVVTQTCDLAQEGDKTPNSAWVQVCPVFNAMEPHPADDGKRLLDGGARKLIEQGRDQFRLHIPGLPDGFWYADLTVEMPIERGWFVGRAPIDGFGGDESAREEVGKRLAWLRSRPAFDSRFVNAVQTPTVVALRDLRKAHPEAYERMAQQVLEIGVNANGRLNIAQVEMLVLYADQLDDDVRQWWHEMWDAWRANAEAEGFNLLPLRFGDLGAGGLPAVEYRALTRLPLASISSNPAWYGADPEGFPAAPEVSSEGS